MSMVPGREQNLWWMFSHICSTMAQQLTVALVCQKNETHKQRANSMPGFFCIIHVWCSSRTCFLWPLQIWTNACLEKYLTSFVYFKTLNSYLFKVGEILGCAYVCALCLQKMNGYEYEWMNTGLIVTAGHLLCNLDTFTHLTSILISTVTDFSPGWACRISKTKALLYYFSTSDYNTSDIIVWNVQLTNMMPQVTYARVACMYKHVFPTNFNAC